MSAEDQAVMARITELAGRINRHKNQQVGLGSQQGSQHVVNHHTGYSGGWRRAAHPYRGYHSARVPVYRNRTLVLNGNSQNKPAETDSSGTSDASTSSWITKADRHLQLINTSVYEKESQARTRAIEQTRRQKRTMRDERERAKLVSHLNRMANNGAMAPPGQTSSDKYEITIQGIRFVVAKNGSKLVKVPGPGNSIDATPKMAIVGGVRFYRSKNGNLYRHGIVKAQRQSGIVKKVDMPCKKFSMTGTCFSGPRCQYIHDPDKVAVCKSFLLQGECHNGDSCDLSHDLIPERTPACLHFARDSCTNPNCRYAHVKVSPGAPVCRAFGLYGYCEKGAECAERHVFECPDFSNTGVCKSKGCKLPHPEKASALRSRKASVAENGEMEDLSSDEDGSVDSDDIDSDEVDEFLGQDGADDFMERDYIEL
ncbi:zinc finger CCCH domain-containing protein 3 [Podospora aff. communis PSN243]|uniref:Zinc finger CCCH domain-containing protein 3 n=1 Tax=Podospora aff. communis PSN243 TaxID=3040156 RepID=A0AAV9GU09_9PEZI|nr:zinc finger CCCH domain-containing protein 3 [Podospora aff. communis PSN243]